MLSFITFIALILGVANAQYHQYEQPQRWTTVQTDTTDSWNPAWDEDATADFQTLAVISPITYGYGYDLDETDFETYGGKSTVTTLPVQFSASPKMQMQPLNPVFESLPETYASPIYAAEVVNTQLIDQPIKAPRIVRQPIIQQRVVEQPIYRTRIVNQPIIRRIVNQPIVRPRITKTTTTKPYTIEEQVVQPKIYEQNVIRQTYSEKQENRQPIVEAATHVRQAPLYSSKRGNY